MAVFPLFGSRTGISEHLTIGLAIVGATLASDYALQRVFKRWRCS